ncbi:MAG TPA: hypothetical protein VFS43_17365 [Polyangiaceae bacterium]|nr:hypothetical protein [Polyangiaceae bacterium]
MRTTRPPTIAPPVWALRVVSALLLCLLAWARPAPPAAWRGAPARPAACSQGEVKAAPARAPGPSFEGARAELREPGERSGGLGPYLPAPGGPRLARPGPSSTLVARAVATPAPRRAPRGPRARGPPAPSLVC